MDDIVFEVCNWRSKKVAVRVNNKTRPERPGLEEDHFGVKTENRGGKDMSLDLVDAPDSFRFEIKTGVHDDAFERLPVHVDVAQSEAQRTRQGEVGAAFQLQLSEEGVEKHRKHRFFVGRRYYVDLVERYRGLPALNRQASQQILFFVQKVVYQIAVE